MKQRVCSLLLGAMLTLTTLLGVAFVLVEVHHNCTGDDCAICAAVAHDVAFLKAEAGALTQLFLTTVALFTVVFAIVILQQSQRRKPSPVTLKVKLSD